MHEPADRNNSSPRIGSSALACGSVTISNQTQTKAKDTCSTWGTNGDIKLEKQNTAQRVVIVDEPC